MSIPYAFVTLLTSDAYLPGALTVAAALKDVHRPLPADQIIEYETVCLVTPETVDVSSIRLLRKAFDVVVGVEVIVPPDTEPLMLLGRPDLDTALTKLHVFRLTQYSKTIFLDADVLPLRPLSHLFHLDHDFSATPDVGWPDIFNSGVMVLSPGEEKFKQLQELLNTKGTWDGADQGLLNEWRGADWNRLSFTYNTTPTATYTYAPAYQRFGSQISVVHFIGPNKPWHSISHTAPGPSTHSTGMAADPITETSVSQNPYDYGSLFDRWYSVYDRHYRSRAVEPVFQPTRYTSAWNEDGPRGITITGGALGLEELRRVALEGMGASGVLASRTHGEGEYRTMPLEGRFDLVRPRTRAEKMQTKAQEDHAETPEPSPLPAPTMPEPTTPVEQIISLPSGSPVRWTTLPTPGINDVPPAPHARLMSLPPTPLRRTSRKSTPLTRDAGAQTVPIQPQERESGRVDLFQTPSISSSSVGTPPNVVTPGFTDTYFPKLWDIDRNWSSVSPSSSETSFTTMEPSPSKSQPTSNALFGPSHAHVTPETPRGQGQHWNVTGEENGPPTWALTKVKRVFPWEERPRHTPGRVFPDDGSPSSSLRRPPFSATPERKFSFRSPMPSPLAGFPPTFQPHFPWNGSLPQRQANKAAWSAASPSPLGLVSGLGRVETDSHDGDIEDEVDPEEEAMMRSRRSSFEKAKRAPRYRSIGVQTDTRELREEGVQAMTFAPVTEGTSVGTTSLPAVGTTDISSPPSLSSTPDSHPLLFSNSRDDGTSTMLTSDEAGHSTPHSHIRRGYRVWDPARGVDVFKRGSEEVLAKFMKIGSWDARA